MKPNTEPVQRPPIVEPCPWCAGDLDIDKAMARCGTCQVEVPLAADRSLAAAA